MIDRIKKMYYHPNWMQVHLFYYLNIEQGGENLGCDRTKNDENSKRSEQIYGADHEGRRDRNRGI